MSAGESLDGLIEDPGSDDLAGASNVLVVASSLADGARQSYFETLLPSDPATTDVLAVEYRRTPDQYVDEWNRYRSAPPQRFGIISVDDAPDGGASPGLASGAVTRVENPDDLTGVGMKIGTYLETHGSADTVLTFDSLTVLLQYVTLERAFRFLHAIAARVRQIEGVAHYHVDPNAHEDAELATLASLFDGVARFRDGAWETRRR